MKTASDIVDLLGGTSAVATSLGRTPSTVSSWREVNFIPDWWRTAILATPAAKRVRLSASDFPTIEQRVPRKKVAA
jgi:hypothetical protein